MNSKIIKARINAKEEKKAANKHKINKMNKTPSAYAILFLFLKKLFKKLLQPCSTHITAKHKKI
jgi:hypothetical protein